MWVYMLCENLCYVSIYVMKLSMLCDFECYVINYVMWVSMLCAYLCYVIIYIMWLYFYVIIYVMWLSMLCDCVISVAQVVPTVPMVVNGVMSEASVWTLQTQIVLTR